MKKLTAILLVICAVQMLAFDKAKYGKMSAALWPKNASSTAEAVEKEIKELEKSHTPGELSEIRLGILYHDASNLGIKNRAEKAYNIFLSANGRNSNSTEIKMVVLVYLGSSRTLMAKDSANPLNKMKYVKEGLSYLDEAVSEYGNDNFLPVYVRGNVCANLPDFFKRKDTAKSDLNRIIKLNKSGSESLPAALVSECYYLLGNISKSDKNTAEALSYWNESIKTAPGSTSADKSARNIKKYGE